jgi:hypothetical protein
MLLYNGLVTSRSGSSNSDDFFEWPWRCFSDTTEFIEVWKEVVVSWLPLTVLAVHGGKFASSLPSHVHAVYFGIGTKYICNDGLFYFILEWV